MVLCLKNQFFSMVPSNTMLSKRLTSLTFPKLLCRYAKDTATDTEMKEAARKANALSFIEKSEFGMLILL